MNNKIKLGLLVVLVVVLAVVLLVLRSTTRVGLQLDSSPQDAVVEIAGTTYASGFIPLEPGTYTVRVDHEAFLPETRTVTIKSGDVATVTVFLNPDGEKGEAWLLDHPEELERREVQGSRVVSDLADQQSKSLPLIADLPHTDNLYTVNYGASKKYPEDGTKAALYVRYYSVEGLAQANEWLLFKNVDLEKTEIIYIDAVEEEE